MKKDTMSEKSKQTLHWKIIVTYEQRSKQPMNSMGEDVGKYQLTWISGGVTVKTSMGVI